jgi:actin-related protein 8
MSTDIARKNGVEKVEILPAPRELDPRLLVWKGAYVLSKLESTSDMWIGENEWNEVGVRCLRDRMLFVW